MDNQFSNFTQYPKTVNSPKRRAFIYLVVFVVLIACAILLGNYLLSSGSKTEEPAATPTQMPTPTESEAVTPEPTVTTATKKTVTPTGSLKLTPTPTKSVSTPSPAVTSTTKSLQVEVLNGSGTPGEAVRAASFLKAAGYLITGTGNADAFTYEQTVIQIKKSKASFGAQLKKDLSGTYTVDPVIQTLAEDSTPDAIVILGAK